LPSSQPLEGPVCACLVVSYTNEVQNVFMLVKQGCICASNKLHEDRATVPLSSLTPTLAHSQRVEFGDGWRQQGNWSHSAAVRSFGSQKDKAQKVQARINSTGHAQLGRYNNCFPPIHKFGTLVRPLCNKQCSPLRNTGHAGAGGTIYKYSRKPTTVNQLQVMNEKLLLSNSASERCPRELPRERLGNSAKSNYAIWYADLNGHQGGTSSRLLLLHLTQMPTLPINFANSSSSLTSVPCLGSADSFACSEIVSAQEHIHGCANSTTNLILPDHLRFICSHILSPSLHLA
jgi:hypothetical protein